MGADFSSQVEFPPDDSGQGFDNIGEVLTVSPLLMEKYVQAAATIVAQSVLTVSRIPRDQSVVPSNNDETTMSFYETDRLARTFTAEHDDQKKFASPLKFLESLSSTLAAQALPSVSIPRRDCNKNSAGTRAKVLTMSMTKRGQRAIMSLPSRSSRLSQSSKKLTRSTSM